MPSSTSSCVIYAGENSDGYMANKRDNLQGNEAIGQSTGKKQADEFFANFL